MITLILIFIIVGLATLPIYVKVGAKYDKDNATQEEKKKSLAVMAGWVAFLLIVATLVLFFPIREQNKEIGSSTKVGVFTDATLYYNAENDTYFSLKTNLWDITNIIEKQTVDYNLAKERVANLESLKDLENKTKFLYDNTGEN